MAEYLSPAVYVEEVPSGVKPIEGVGTSTAAFVGHAERGPIGEPVKLTNFGQFLDRFGGFIDNGNLAYAVRSFFEEGGTTCYVVRTAHYAVPSGSTQAQPTAIASEVTRPGFRRNGLAVASKVEARAGIEDFRVDQSQGAAYLLSYGSSNTQITLIRIEDNYSESVDVEEFPPGTTMAYEFPNLGATVVVNDAFDISADISADPATYIQVGTGELNGIQIAGVTGDISGITSAELSVDATNPTECTFSFDAFTSSFDGTDTTGAQEVGLTDGNGNELVISITVSTAFDGSETGSAVDLAPLANLLLWLGRRLTIRAASPGDWGNDLSIEVIHEGVDRFGLAVSYRGSEVETIPDLSMNQLDARFVEAVVGRESTYIVTADATTTRPAVVSEAALRGGSDGLTALASTDYVGDPTLRSGLYAFDAVDAINMVAVPDAVNRDVHVGGMAYCAGRRDCVYLADCQQNITSSNDVLHYKLAQGTYTGANAFGSKYGALYAPWILVHDPRTKGRREIPPSGAVAGRLAATDAARGVHKAAAGILDGKLRSALGLAFDFTAADQETLNPKGINVLRRFSGVGNLIWGARTVSVDPEWRYLNVRRLFLSLEKSIEESTSWVVFEPNDRTLWKSIERNVSAFLKLQWMQGALVGTTPEQAYYVKCDEETNPPESIDLGRVITEIGVAPSKPAEFVIFRISQFAGGSEVSE